MKCPLCEGRGGWETGPHSEDCRHCRGSGEIEVVAAKTTTTLPKPKQNPNGLHSRYRIAKADGSPCDPNAIYFVLRLDSGGSDPIHIEACREAALAYSRELLKNGHLRQLAYELEDLVRRMSDG